MYTNMKKNSDIPWQKQSPQTHVESSLQFIDQHPNAMFTKLFSIDYKDYEVATESPLKGAIFSIKDLFDVAGYQTKGGSVFLDKEPPAIEDAEAVKKLREAGVVLIGHTNMTELAYSGLGLNPHYGTPEIPNQPGRIAGGSTSGGAASVASGAADFALGTDTGGSLRIPAAFCGLTGFKPSQDSISRKGCLPLSPSLDAVGVISHTVAQCEFAWQVMSGNQLPNPPTQNITLVIPSNFGLDNLDEAVHKGFLNVIETLKAANIKIEERALPFLEDYKLLPVWQFSAVESFNYYGERYDLNQVEIDPRVKSRMDRAHSVSKEEFQTTLQKRESLIAHYAEQGSVLLLPTVAIVAPRKSNLTDDKEYDRINLLCLRNTSLANVLDGCSISLPFQHEGENIGVMLITAKHKDNEMLSIAKHIESVLSGL